MPSFTRIVPGTLMQAQNVNQIIDALDGATGAGVPIAVTAVNDAVNFALTVQNDEPTNQRALNVLNASGVSLIRVDAAGVTLGSPLNLPTGSVTAASIADGTITSSKLAAPLDVTGFVRSRGLAGGAPASGAGLELYYDGTEGVVQAYDRSGGAYLPLTILGGRIVLSITGGNTVVVDASGNVTMAAALSVAGNVTTSGSVTAAGNLFGNEFSGHAVATDSWVNTPTLYLDSIGGTNTRYIQDANPTIRYAVPSGGVHSFEIYSGGYAPLNCGVLTTSGRITASAGISLGSSTTITFGVGDEQLICGENFGKANTVYMSDHAYVFFDLGVGHNVTCQTLIQTSDPRLKSGATVISDSDCMTRIRANVPVYSYQLPPPSGGSDSSEPTPTPTDIGFMADDVHANSPEFSALDDQGVPVGVAYSNMAALLWGALRELDARCQAAGI